jgi:peptidoglycan/xylan/chitin deacetylase (PgdA/CDA1 family)
VLVFGRLALATEFRPARVLLVIGDQWDDPSGFLVREGNEFHEIVSLLKNWGIPFDIVRLDQRRLDRNDFVGFDGKALYGAILWDADPHSFPDQDLKCLAEAVERWNIGLVALSNRIHHPVLESLLGLHYRGYYSSSAPIVPKLPENYLLKGLPNPLDTNDDPRIELTTRGIRDAKIPWQFAPFKKRVLVDNASAEVLASQGGIPQITEREVRPGVPAIWIGSDYLQFLHFQALRTVLRRALAAAVGFQLYRDWSLQAILELDDMGSAQNAWLEHWHYPTLTQEQIEKNLIAPLEKNHAVLVLNICPGFVDRSLHTILPSFQQVFTDEFGTRQDYVSTKGGIDEGLRRGVFEIQSHGWTHMQPDLDSPPGPWWDASLYEEKAEVGWYREFGDTRRDKEIPAAVQRLHLERSREWLVKEFGVEPLSFVAGGNGISESQPNNTTAIAARVGFGWFGDYIGPDLAVEALQGYSGMGASEFGGTADAPLGVWVPPDGHDRGIYQHPEQFTQIFDQLGGWHYLHMNEYIAYLHARISTNVAGEAQITLNYDDHYCRFFRDHTSHWQLEMPGTNGTRRVFVDGKPREVFFQSGRGQITIPAGLGEHTILFREATTS